MHFDLAFTASQRLLDHGRRLISELAVALPETGMPFRQCCRLMSAKACPARIDSTISGAARSIAAFARHSCGRRLALWRCPRGLRIAPIPVAPAMRTLWPGRQQRVVRDRSFNGIRFDTVSQDHLPAIAAIEPDGNGNHHLATIPANGDLASDTANAGSRFSRHEIILKCWSDLFGLVLFRFSHRFARSLGVNSSTICSMPLARKWMSTLSWKQ